MALLPPSYRLIGLSLINGELFPMKLCRHVIKYLIGRPVSWHSCKYINVCKYMNHPKDKLEDVYDYLLKLHLVKVFHYIYIYICTVCTYTVHACYSSDCVA